MITKIAILSLLLITLSKGMDNLGPNIWKKKVPIKVYSVYPHTPFEEKWKPAFEEHKEDFLAFEKWFFPQAAARLTTMTVKDIPRMAEEYASKSKQNAQFISDIRKMAKLTGISFESSFLMQFTYEIFVRKDGPIEEKIPTMGCTAVVIRDALGEVFMAKNLDYAIPAFQKLSIQFDHYDHNGKLEYSTSQFVGYLISVHGIRYGAYSIALNQRNHLEDISKRHGFDMGWALNEYAKQQLLHTHKTYESVVQALREVKLIASCYYIVVGLESNEGIILERTMDRVVNEYTLSDDRWYLVATNYDQPENICSGYVDDGRMQKAKDRLDDIGQEDINEENLFYEVMMQFSTFNMETLSTMRSNPSKNRQSTVVWIQE